MSIKRFYLSNYDNEGELQLVGGPYMEESVEGDYVLYSDHAAELERLRRGDDAFIRAKNEEIEKLKAEIERLKTTMGDVYDILARRKRLKGASND